MTETIIAFPTMFERDQIEFDRFGTSSYTRAFDEAAAMVTAMLSGTDRASLKGRTDAFVRLFNRLAIGRPEVVGEFVVLDDGMQFELRVIPPLLAAFSLRGSDGSVPQR